MSDQINLFPVEMLPERTPPVMRLEPKAETAKDPGCFIVRARWRDMWFGNQKPEFLTLEAAEKHASRMHAGWNNRRIYHLGESETCKWTEDENGRTPTQCGHAFEFTAGWVKENKFTFCPFCGRRIEV